MKNLSDFCAFCDLYGRAVSSAPHWRSIDTMGNGNFGHWFLCDMCYQELPEKAEPGQCSEDLVKSDMAPIDDGGPELDPFDGREV